MINETAIWNRCYAFENLEADFSKPWTTISVEGIQRLLLVGFSSCIVRENSFDVITVSPQY